MGIGAEPAGLAVGRPPANPFQIGALGPGANRNRARAIAGSSDTSGKSKDQDDVGGGEKEQAVGQRNMDKQPGPEQKLVGVMVIQPVFLPDEDGDSLQREALLLVEVTLDIPDFAQDALTGPSSSLQWREQFLRPLKKGRNSRR